MMQGVIERFEIEIMAKDGKLPRRDALISQLERKTDEEILSLIQESCDPIEFMRFFAITGLVVRKDIVCDKRTLCVTMFGAYSAQENTEKMPLGESGFFASWKYVPKTLKNEDLDVYITENVRYISESGDYKNYIVVPLDREVPFGNPKRDKEFEEFYVPKRFFD